MQVVSRRQPPPASSPSSIATTEAAANNGSKKKSILKKSEAASSHSRPNCKDPELETLLVSDHSSNSTPASTRRGLDPLPPTTNSDQLKALTGPKLRLGCSSSSKKPPTISILSNNAKNNGNVASKEIQTSTASLLALAASTANNNINNGGEKKFERGREAAVADMQSPPSAVSTAALAGLNQPVFKCPNDMCRHNKASTAVTASKRKICVCGRTMVNQNLLLESSDVAGLGGHHRSDPEANLAARTTSPTSERISSS